MVYVIMFLLLVILLLVARLTRKTKEDTAIGRAYITQNDEHGLKVMVEVDMHKPEGRSFWRRYYDCHQTCDLGFYRGD